MTRKIGRLIRMGLFALPLALSGTALAQSAGGGLSGGQSGGSTSGAMGTGAQTLPDIEDQRLDNPTGSDRSGLPGSSDARRRAGTSTSDDIGRTGMPGSSASDRVPVSGSDDWHRGSDVRGGSINDTRVYPQSTGSGRALDHDDARTEPGTKSSGTPGSMGTTDSTNAPGTSDYRSGSSGSSYHSRDTYNLDRDEQPGDKGIRDDGSSGRVGVSGKDEAAAGSDTAKGSGDAGEKKTKKTKKTVKKTETTTESSGAGTGTGGTAK